MINNLAYEQGNCEIYNCSCLNLPIADNSIDCVVTSPPYWGLRDYGTARWVGGLDKCEHIANSNAIIRDSGNSLIPGWNLKRRHAKQKGYYYEDYCLTCGAKKIDMQLGHEDSLDSYIQNLVEAFREVWRVLKPTGTVWLNLGDCYSNYRPGKGQKLVKQTLSKTNQDLPEQTARRGNRIDGVKEKELIGIPWRVALALQADGWYLRQDIIWHKPNPMPESVKDRCTKSHEYIFLLTKDFKYYYDNEAIMEETKTGNSNQRKNKRDVWTVPTKGYKGAHFAVFPETLITPCILAGSSAKGCCSECGSPYKRDFNIITKPERSTAKSRGNMLNVIPGRDKLSRLNSKDMESIKKEFKEWVPTCNCQASIVPSVVLDIFSGSGTTVVTAIKNGRKGIGIELNKEYVELSIDRIKQTSMQHCLL